MMKSGPFPHETLGKSRQPTGKMLVLGEDTRVVLAVARSLGRRNICVHVGWCPSDAPALCSKYVAVAHDLRHPAEKSGWRSGLRSVLKREDFDLVVPATEAAMHPLQRERAMWENEALFWLPNREAFEITADKLKTQRLAETLAIPTPRTLAVADSQEVPPHIVDQIGWPVIVKPLCSVDVSDPLRKNPVRKAYTPDELSEQIRQVTQGADRALIQNDVPGRGVGVEILSKRGRILVAFQHLRIHETMGFGSTYRKSVPLDPELLNAAGRLIRALEYTGVAMIEFRVDPRIGSWVLLEINSRFWGSLPLAVVAGADFPYYLYQMMCESRESFPENYRIDVRSRNLVAGTRWMVRSLRSADSLSRPEDNDAFGWEVNHVSRRYYVWHLLRAATLRDHIDSFALDDPKPGFREAWDLCRFLARRIIHWLSAAEQPSSAPGRKRVDDSNGQSVSARTEHEADRCQESP